MASGDATFDASSACNGCNVWKRWDDNGDNPQKRDVVAIQSGDGFIVIKNDDFQMNEFCIKTPNLPVGTYCNLGSFFTFLLEMPYDRNSNFYASKLTFKMY